MVQNPIDLSHLYLVKASTFYEGAQMIIESPAYDWQRHDAVVLNNLLLSIEMSLKACKYKLNGSEVKTHTIDAFLLDAIKSGFSVDAHDARQVFLAAKPYGSHAPRYAPLAEENTGMASANLMAPVALRILQSAKVFLSSDPSTHDGVSYEEAQKIKGAADRIYKEQVTEFRPTRVYDTKDAPDLPLGFKVTSSRPKI